MDHLDYLPFTLACLLAAVLLHIFVPREAGRPYVRLAVAGALAVILGTGWIFVGRAQHNAMMSMRDMIAGIAPTYAAELEVMGHERLTPATPPDDPDYLRMIEAEKRWLAANPAVADIYTYKKLPDGTIALFVDSETDYDHSGAIDDDREARTALGEVYDEVDEPILQAFAGEKSFSDEPYTDRWGHWVSANVPLFDKSGHVDGVLGVDFDARTWLASMNRARHTVIFYLAALVALVLVAGAGLEMLLLAVARARRSEKEAELASRTKSEFLANMSHEIRTPMTAILGYADLMLDPQHTQSDRIDYLQIIRRNGEHLLAIINDILDISKIEAGKMTLEKIETNLSQVLEEVSSLMSHRTAAKKLNLNIAWTTPAPAAVLGDPVRVRQILINLVGNAIKFTEKGGIRVQAAWQNSEVLINVIDSGIGMTPEQVGRLFNAFTQADGSMTRRFGGTGLGLTISKRLAQMMGGDITVSSAQGQGSTFTLRIRAEQVAPAAAAAQSAGPAAAAPSQPLAGLRILLAEDGPDNQRLISFILKKAGATVDLAENGRIAADKALGEQFDIILMDMQMPELDGYSAASLLRTKKYAGPIIALTAHAMAEDRARCIQAGCDDYATKPVDKAKLIATITKHARPAPRSAAA